jgi:PPOX class probable F420-dependent enzyme
MSDDVTAQLGDEKFVSLTTFKRDGNPVASPMWIVRDGPQLWLWTPATASKVKRVRRNPRVTLTPCGRTGKVRTGAAGVDATAEVLTDVGEVARIESLLKRKYGVEFWVVVIVETIAARGRKPRVLIRVAL